MNNGAHMRSQRWAILGGSGFVGRSVRAAVEAQGIDVLSVPAPRLVLAGTVSVETLLAAARDQIDAVRALASSFSGCDVVINAAGIAAPDSAEDPSLTGANAMLPVVALLAADAAGARRFLHMSSAAVQGRRRVLDESPESAPVSPYGRSKALGEAALARIAPDLACPLVTVRATSVQGRGRQTTARLRRLARSRIASVASPGDQPTVVSSAAGLGAFVTAVGLEDRVTVPSTLLQPWESVSVRDVLQAAGGRPPLVLPRPLCRAATALGYAAARVYPGLAGAVRRVELMWFGQEQDAAWARSQGYDPAPPTVVEVLADPDGGSP